MWPFLLAVLRFSFTSSGFGATELNRLCSLSDLLRSRPQVVSVLMLPDMLPDATPTQIDSTVGCASRAQVCSGYLHIVYSPSGSPQSASRRQFLVTPSVFSLNSNAPPVLKLSLHNVLTLRNTLPGRARAPVPGHVLRISHHAQMRRPHLPQNVSLGCTHHHCLFKLCPQDLPLH